MSELKELINEINSLNQEIERLEEEIIECQGELKLSNCYTKGLKWNLNSCAYDSVITPLLFPKNKYVRKALKDKNKSVRYNVTNPELLRKRKELDAELDKIIDHIDNPRKTSEISCTDYRRILREIRQIQGKSPIMKLHTDTDWLDNAFTSLIEEYNLDILFINVVVGKYLGEKDVKKPQYRPWNNPQEIVDNMKITSCPKSNIIVIDYAQGLSFGDVNKMFEPMNINGKILYLHAIPYQCWDTGGHFCAYIKCGKNWYKYNGIHHGSDSSWVGPKSKRDVIRGLNKLWRTNYGSFVGIYWDNDELN